MTEREHMNLPRRLKISGLDYHILAHPGDLVIRELVGETIHRQLTVGIDITLPIQLQQTTLLHELLHCISTVYLDEDRLTEGQVSSLEAGLFQVLGDNPEVAAFIWGYKEVEGGKVP